MCARMSETPNDEPGKVRFATIYARVSTPQQREGTSWETQVGACREDATKNNFVVPEQYIFEEVGSGADPARPLFLKFNSLIESGRIQAVFIYDPDRYSREPIILEILSEMCDAANVELHFIHGTSGTGMDQNLMRYLEGYVAKKERLKILLRTSEGKARVLESGRPPHGWGVGIYGYEYDRDTKKRSINTSEASTVRQIFQWFADGLSLFAIAEKLQESGIPTKANKRWHHLTVNRILRNERYIGLDVYGKYRSFAVPGGGRRVELRPKEEWKFLTGFTPPILDGDLFNRVQELLAQMDRTSSRRNTDRPRYWLTGYTYCGKCGSRVHGSMVRKNRRYYSCRATRKTEWSPPTCDERYIPADELEGSVWRTMVETVQTPGVVMLGIQDHVDVGQDLNQEIRDLEDAVANLTNQEKNLIRLMALGGVDKSLVESELQPINSQRMAHENRIQQLRNTLSNRRKFGKAMGRVRRYARAFGANLEGMDVEGKIKTLSVLDAKITAVRGRFSIELHVDPNQ